ncbi:MAG TPA: hypothetical protein VFJ90_12065, partial [Candidatus Didemnitutus sp.]|nr:hypothetical protein [Candidatus Didemnitutus sp.]
VHAYSLFHWDCGIYQLDYRIFCTTDSTEDETGSAHGATRHDTGRLTMWKFAKLPADADSFLIVDQSRSEFIRPVALGQYGAHDKRTVYTLTHAKGMQDLKKENHWELEDTTKWPDCEYEIDVWAMNIKKANGPGVAPDLNEVKHWAKFKVETAASGDRRITVTKAFSDKP